MLTFMGGKGGVGKTSLARALAVELALGGTALRSAPKKILLVTIEDARHPAGQLLKADPAQGRPFDHLNIDALQSFEEYIGLKLGGASLARLFVGNKLIQYLAEAAPGLSELVILGKIWFERTHYDEIIIDLPSTGYGLTLFSSPINFARLFQGGPIAKDALAMLETFNDPNQTQHWVIALAEEMPLQEAIELDQKLHSLFPKTQSGLWINKLLFSPHAMAGAFSSSSPNQAPKSASEDLLVSPSLESYAWQKGREESKQFEAARDYASTRHQPLRWTRLLLHPTPQTLRGQTP